ncbi:hypothetical protein ACEPAH_7054 [Sanghuangporus vaninii]
MKVAMNWTRPQLELRGKMCYANFLKYNFFCTGDAIPFDDVELGESFDLRLIRKIPKAFTKGTDQPSRISSHQSVLSSIDGGQQRSEQEGSAVPKSENVDNVLNSAELPRSCSSSPVVTSVLSEVKNGRCGYLLQFTSDCSFLASALWAITLYRTIVHYLALPSSNIVTLYDVVRSFTIPHANPVQQISWNPDTPYY